MLLAGLLLPLSARAMQFAAVPLADQHTLIEAVGPILPGDFRRFLAIIETASNGTHLAGIMLNSPGGLILEAEKMAGTINDMGLSAAIAPGGGCASACFLMFAAAHRRAAAPGALIGVHRASYMGRETESSLGATDGMAMQLRDYGVPPSIITRMQQTPPGGVAWLTSDELSAMHVVLYHPIALARLPPPQPPSDAHVVVMPGSPGAQNLPGTIIPSPIAADPPTAADFGLGG